MADAKALQIELDAALVAELERTRPLTHAAREYDRCFMAWQAVLTAKLDNSGERRALGRAETALRVAASTFAAAEAQP